MPTAQELQEQGVKLFMQHDYEAAAKAFHQAKDAFAQAQQQDMVAEMKVNIGLVHRALGENQQALDLMHEALKAFQEQEDLLRMAKVLGNMGGVYLAMNDKEQAYNVYRQAADTFRDLGETQLYSETLQALGAMQLRDGKILTGATTYRVGLEMLDADNLNPRQKILKRLATFIDSFSNR